jgi:PKD repeat protein
MRKFYLLLNLFLILIGRQTAQAQDTTGCDAAFQATVVDSIVYFRAMDSMPGVRHTWNFGDGTISTGAVVTHIYLPPGTYAVTQAVSDSARQCQNSATQMITIGNSGATCSVYLTFSGDSTGQIYRFFANPVFSGGANAAITWTINDTLAGYGDTLNRFLPNGPYIVCANLVVTNQDNQTVCSSQSCVTINPQDSVATQPPPPPDTCTIAFTAVQNGQTPNQYVFALVDGERYDSISWTIIGPDSLFAGPYSNRSFTYTFPDTGYYDVYVTAEAQPGCWVSNGQAIHIDSVQLGSGHSITSYPNPATTQVTLNVTLDSYTTIDVRVYNSMGGLLLTRIVNGDPGVNQITLPIANLPPGVYYVELESRDLTLRSKFQKL